MKRNDKGNRIAVGLALSLALTCTLPQSADAANSGGIPGPNAIPTTSDDYVGSLDGATITAKDGNVWIDSDVAGAVYGGLGDAVVNVENNHITINGGTIGQSVYAGSAGVNTTGNSVTMNGGTIKYHLYGGVGENNASGNTVTINGGTIEGDIFGGYSVGRGNTLGSIAINNTVTVSGTPTLGSSTGIWGGYAFPNNSGVYDAFTGNTLNWGAKTSVQNVANFEYYNFVIPASANPGDTLLNLTGPYTTTTDMAGSKVKLLGVEGDRKWEKGESVILIQNDIGGISGDPTLIEGKTTQGIKRYDYELALDDNSITATITGSGLGDQAKSLSEGRMAGLGFLNGGADLLTDGGMASALTSAASGAAAGAYDTFGALGYAGTTLESGSHVDIKGTSLVVGASRNLNIAGNDWMIGMFVEGGKGSYDTYNNFEGAGEVHADGENKYWGVGMMARSTNKANVYTEGSLRVGKISTDYDSRDIQTTYDSKATYYGAHVGLGKIIKLNEKADLDIYGKYLWSKQSGDTVNIDGENFNFESLNSNRVRVGARIQMKKSSGVATYIGLAYEHEFSGNAAANTGGESVMEPSVKGGTGIGELGIQYKPKEDGNFSVNAGLTGYTGKREGLGGNIRFAWGF